VSDHQSAQRPRRAKQTAAQPQQPAPDVSLETPPPAFDHLPHQPLTPKAVLALQASHGNAYVNRLLQRSGQVSLRAGRLIIQRDFDLPEEKKPEKWCKDKKKLDLVKVKGYPDEAFWPKGRTLRQWINALKTGSTGEDVLEKWEIYLEKVAADNVNEAFRNLTLTVDRLKKHLDKTYLSDLTDKELDEKKKMMRELIKAIPPGDFGVWNLDNYKRKLKEKVLASPRYMRAVKGKPPYVEHAKDDDASPTGFNAKLLDDMCDEIRGTNLNNDEAPGEDTDWSQWRGNDCVFAGIAAVLLGKNARPSDEKEDEAKAVIIAQKLNLKKGPVQDPVLLYVMEKLGWPYQSGLTWTTFQQNADKTRPHIISYDTIPSGIASHVVLTTYNNSKNKWEIYDRQGIRLGNNQTPQYDDNSLDAWKVEKSEFAKEIFNAIK
jgi:hypothetical protein